MKEITRVHLAKTPYSVEVDAKRELEKYLQEIEKRMAGDTDVMREIEARMVELLEERGVSRDGVISAVDVNSLREQMGEPSEFSEEPEADSVVDVEPEEKPSKRLMRDTDNAVLGGVSAGIAAYFNINPLWVRLLMIISPFMTVGTSILIYIALWLAMPPARTAAEKLQMRGQAVTLDALKNQAEEDEGRQPAEHVVLKIGRFMLGAFLVAVTFSLFIGLVVGGAAGLELVTMLDGFSAQSGAWTLWIILAIGGVAGVMLAALLAQSVFRKKVGRTSGVLMLVMLAIAAFSVSGAAIAGTYAKAQFAQDERRLTKVVPIELPKNLEGVKDVRSDNDDVFVTINPRGDKIRAELKYLSVNNDKVPEVTVKRDGDTLAVTREGWDDFDECSRSFFGGWGLCSFSQVMQVRFYGPVDYFDRGFESDIELESDEV